MKPMKPKKNSAMERIQTGLQNAIAHAQGRKTLTVREVELPDPPKPMTPAQIVLLRTRVLGVSQPVFASMVKASLQTVHAWEQGRAKPDSALLAYLAVIDREPEAVQRALEGGG